MSKKKRYLILLLTTLVLSATTAGIYLFINSDTNTSSSYTVDKYSAVTNWCETSTQDHTLKVGCKALLINIGSNSCFEMQVITQDNKLKDLAVCENGDQLTYSNDVLGYKKLMPIDIIFTYNKDGILGEYTFSNVSFNKVDDKYIQSIVNEDIANLIKIAPSTTTIKNSVDFCPRPETLPNYIEEENRKSYTLFYSENVMDQAMYRYGSMYSFEDTGLRILLGRDSQMISKNSAYFANPSIEVSEDIQNEAKISPIILDWSKRTDKKDEDLLKEISLLYDNIDEITLESKSDLLFSLFKAVNTDTQISAEVYCSMGKLLTLLNYSSGGIYTNYINNIKEDVAKNVQTIGTALCQDFIDKEKLDYTGIYIQLYMNISAVNQNSNILNNCLNLYEVLD